MVDGVVEVPAARFVGASDATLAGAMADADAAFSHSNTETYQKRAHEYLVHRGVCRECGDTAVQRVVRDIAERAYLAGKADARSLEGASEALSSAMGAAVELMGSMGSLRRALGM